MDDKGPIFVLGFPRSGTTAMATALGSAQSIQGPSEEGHYLYFLAEMIQTLRSGKNVNPASVLSKGAKLNFFEQEIALAVQRFNERLVAPCDVWLDKTPDLRQVKCVPVYASLFAGARFLFMYRDPIEVIESNMSNWPHIRRTLSKTTKRWVKTMSTWRSVRENLSPNSYLEIGQRDMRRDPRDVMAHVGKFLGLPRSEQEAIGKYLANHKVSTTIGNTGSPPLKLTWLERRRTNRIVAPELERWVQLQKTTP